MEKPKKVRLDDFTLKKAKIENNGVYVEFNEKRVIDGETKVLEHTINLKNCVPHPDLIGYRDSLKEFLIMALSLNKGFDLALKYLTGGKKAKAEEAILDLYSSVDITSISISGEDQLRGAVISGKIESFNGSKCALNTPRIVFSSDKIGIEQTIEGKIELIENEIYKYLFNGKRAQKELFDSSDDEGNPPKAETVKKGEPAGVGLS